MALFIPTGHGDCSGGRIICTNPTKQQPYTHHHRPQIFFPLTPNRGLHIIVSAKKFSSSSRTGRFDSKNRRSSITTRDQEDDTDNDEKVNDDIGGTYKTENVSTSSKSSSIDVDDNYDKIIASLPGNEPDFWEGPQWDALGFFVQYLWAFGIVFALIACGIAVVTYNEGATDFKETPAYKESVQSRELLEEPDASNSDVFESNPTEVAPSLD